MTDAYPGRVGLQQRVLPSYRAPFIEALASACQGGLSVFAGQPLPGEGIDPAGQLNIAQHVKSSNRSFGSPASPFFICWQAGFMRWLEAWQPEVLIVEANPRYLSTRQAISWMHHHGRNVVGWGLGAPPLSGFMAGFRARERQGFLGSLDAIIAYSRQGADQYRQLGIPSGRVFVAPNAVAPAPQVAAPVRARRPGERLCVLFIGRLQVRKRVDLLLQACNALPAGLQPRLVIVGEGPARAELISLASRIYPVAEFTGAKHGSELEPYLTKADLFVLPGTGGLAIQQAMAYGLPVIVAQGDGTQDDLVREVNGWQVPPGDLPALTATLLQALSDPARLIQMGTASHAIVANEINIEAMVGAFVRVFNELAAPFKS